MSNVEEFCRNFSVMNFTLKSKMKNLSFLILARTSSEKKQIGKNTKIAVNFFLVAYQFFQFS